MSLFDKVKRALVEEEPDTSTVGTDYQLPEEPSVEVDTSKVDGQNADEVVQSVYSQDTFPEDKSIFRIQEFIDTLPDEMPTQTKYNTIRGILNASRIDILDLISDAEKRITLLGAAHDGIKEEHQALCDEANGHIADFMAAIEAAKVKMQDSQVYTTQTCDILETEAVKVRKLLEFANGVVDSTPNS